jgi:outer membrane protein OmpA-like peptidoglycan-associated protein
MKKYLLSLSMAALTIPVAAQQSQPSSPADQPATQSQAQTQAAPAADQAATGKEPLKYERHEGFWGKVNPFARKKYVTKQLDPIRGRVNELDELTAKNSRMIADVDARATEGIRNAMNKANEADTHAVDAGSRADQANQTAQAANTHVTSVETTVANLDQYQAVTQAEIRFRPGQQALSKNAKEALDQMATSLKGQKGYILEVQGFSPGTGGTAIESSREMAQMVVRYLVLNHDIPVYRIYTVGMGNAPLSTEDGKLQRARGGRVEISLMKNSLATGTAASGPTSSAAAPQSTNSGTATDKPARPPL